MKEIGAGADLLVLTDAEYEKLRRRGLATLRNREAARPRRKWYARFEVPETKERQGHV